MGIQQPLPGAGILVPTTPGLVQGPHSAEQEGQLLGCACCGGWGCKWPSNDLSLWALSYYIAMRQEEGKWVEDRMLLIVSLLCH